MASSGEQTAQARGGDARPKLAVIGLSYPFRGGISHYTTLLVRALRKDYDVTFISFIRQYPGFLFPGKTQFDESAKALIEPNERILDTLNPMSWIRAARILNAEAPDLIIIQWWHPFFAPMLGTIVSRLKPAVRNRVCFLCHNVLPHEGNPLQALLAKFAFRSAPFFIVHSEQDRQQLAEIRPGAIIRKGSHPTYSEFGDWDSFSKEEARQKLDLASGTRTILYFGLVRAYKGLTYLIDAMPLVLEKIDCQLLVVGEFYDAKEPYLSGIERSGAADRIRVVDRYIPNEEVALYFASADVVVLPYTSATQSGIVQIAFGLRTPVITTDVGGLPEAVDDGKTGFVVGAQDARQLADAIIRYYDGDFEPRFRSEIARQASRFDWKEEIKLIEELRSTNN